MRLLLLAALALAAAAPARAVLTFSDIGNRAGGGALGDAVVVLADNTNPQQRSPNFGDGSLAASTLSDSLPDSFGATGLPADAARLVLAPGRDAALPEPAGWAVVAAAALTLLGLLGLRRRAR